MNKVAEFDIAFAGLRGPYETHVDKSLGEIMFEVGKFLGSQRDVDAALSVVDQIVSASVAANDNGWGHLEFGWRRGRESRGLSTVKILTPDAWKVAGFPDGWIEVNVLYNLWATDGDWPINEFGMMLAGHIKIGHGTRASTLLEAILLLHDTVCPDADPNPSTDEIIANLRDWVVTL